MVLHPLPGEHRGGALPRRRRSRPRLAWRSVLTEDRSAGPVRYAKRQQKSGPHPRARPRAQPPRVHRPASAGPVAMQLSITAGPGPQPDEPVQAGHGRSGTISGHAPKPGPGLPCICCTPSPRRGWYQPARHLGGGRTRLCASDRGSSHRWRRRRCPITSLTHGGGAARVETRPAQPSPRLARAAHPLPASRRPAIVCLLLMVVAVIAGRRRHRP
jgi:hypothetical protein